jgi:hypothetical protein
MNAVLEIKAAIERLSAQERCELEGLLHPWPNDAWDEQMTADSAPGGKLHQLMQASKRQAKAGNLKNFPSA